MGKNLFKTRVVQVLNSACKFGWKCVLDYRVNKAVVLFICCWFSVTFFNLLSRRAIDSKHASDLF